MASTAKPDIYQQVTDQILEQLEQGIVAWRKPWASNGSPRNFVSGHVYQGMNTFLLALRPFFSPFWLSFKQAQERGGSVRKGEHGAKIIFWKMLAREDESGDSKSFPYLNSWTVFNTEQCDGLDVP